ncbi:DUF6087 family protein [Streptomyces sp. S186]|uniref:DUF6087 family protein n=1 Tax=Streptomyces sp. S186 TaxID=3434395 RepID=UPI003F675AEB
MAKHRRPGAPNRPSRAIPRVDDSDPLAPYQRRRRPPLDIWRRHRPMHGAGGHLRPDEPRVLEQWDGFAYQIVGTATDLAAARKWVNQAPPGDEAAAV